MGAGEESYTTVRYPAGQARGASYQEVHHVRLVVPQCLDGMEDVHGSLVPEHFTDNADGTEGATAASSVPVTEKNQVVGQRLPSPCFSHTTCGDMWSTPWGKVRRKVQRGQAGLACGPQFRPSSVPAR